jgi:hypothetical protein
MSDSEEEKKKIIKNTIALHLIKNNNKNTKSTLLLHPITHPSTPILSPDEFMKIVIATKIVNTTEQTKSLGYKNNNSNIKQIQSFRLLYY